MNGTPVPLSSPPNYEYQTTGPWFICQVDKNGASKAWIMWTFESAILRFWLAEETPPRRVMVDSYGVTVLGSQSESPDKAVMSGTRQTMEGTLAMVANGSAMEEAQVTVLQMIETVRALDGQAL